MWVIFILGMPGSGKSTVARDLYYRLLSLFSLIRVNPLVEVSEVVHQWVADLSGDCTRFVDVYTTEKKSLELYYRVWSRFSPYFNICVGARELHLLTPPPHYPCSDLRVLTISLLLSAEERRRRYILRSIREGKKTRLQANALFEKVESRAIELGLPHAMDRCDFQIAAFGRDPTEIATFIWQDMWRKGVVE